MSRIQGSPMRKAIFGGLVALSLSGAAVAQTPASASSMVRPSPNGDVVSANSDWQVYVYAWDDITFIQINDRKGAVRAVVGVPNGQSIVFKVEPDAQAAAMPTPRVISGAPRMVYQGNAMTVTATPQSDGTTIFRAAAADCPSYGCSGPGVTSSLPH